MRVLLSIYSSRANFSPMVRFVAQPETLGAAARRWDVASGLWR